MTIGNIIFHLKDKIRQPQNQLADYVDTVIKFIASNDSYQSVLM